MRDTLSLLVLTLLSLDAAGCRSHPCGDQSAELPGEFGGAPLVGDGGKVCGAQKGQATVMYWADEPERDKIATHLLARMDAEGWTYSDADGPVDPQKRTYVFRRGDEEIGASFHLTQTPRLGSKLPADSLTVYFRHHRLKPADRPKR
jgi:hypothetical protein